MYYGKSSTVGSIEPQKNLYAKLNTKRRIYLHASNWIVAQVLGKEINIFNTYKERHLYTFM